MRTRTVTSERLHRSFRKSPTAETLGYARTVLQELAWTTRCVICDEPGTLLCARCRAALPYIDRWQACPHCGAPNGRIICTECNHFTLSDLGMEELPYRQCISALLRDERSRRIVTTYKDAGEQRLARLIAALCADTLSPAIGAHGRVLCFIPSSNKARVRRGFDHAELTARYLAAQLRMPLAPLFVPPQTQDQRTLNRQERQENMRNHLVLAPAFRAAAPERVLIYDDVLTTGATLCAASEALAAAGSEDIRCVTLLRGDNVTKTAPRR